jgi:hypothetical protein
VRHTHHVSYHRCEPAADGHDTGEDAAAEALAIVERSMRNNQYYSAALKSSLARDVRAQANIHFAEGAWLRCSSGGGGLASVHA